MKIYRLFDKLYLINCAINCIVWSCLYDNLILAFINRGNCHRNEMKKKEILSIFYSNKNLEFTDVCQKRLTV